MRNPHITNLEELEDAIRFLSEGVKFARKNVQRAVQAQKAETVNAGRRKPRACRSKTRRRRRRAGPNRIGPAPGYTPKELPPVGEKWVHIGSGTFIPLRKYRAQLKQRKRKQDRAWNS